MKDDELSPSRIFPSLRLGRYRFVLEPKGPISLPAYQGSTWRGVIGNALLDVVCPWDKKDCEPCSNRDSCGYHYLYDAGLTEKAFASLPRPYIFSPVDGKGRELSVEMTLVGGAGAFLPHLVAAWIRAGERGVGKGRRRFELKEAHEIFPDGSSEAIYCEEGVTRYDETSFYLRDYLTQKFCDPPWTIAIETPLRLRQNGRNVQVIDWGDAFKSLAIKLSLLSQKYCNGLRPTKDLWAALMAFLSEPGSIRNHTQWFDWKRFSSRQGTHIPMGGLVGKSVITSVNNASLWRHWWQTASLFHLGKATSMGLGKVRIINFTER